MGGTATDGRCDTNAGIRGGWLCPTWSVGGRPRHQLTRSSIADARIQRRQKVMVLKLNRNRTVEMHHRIVKASGIFPRRTNVAEGYNRTGKRLAVEIPFLRRVLGVLACINPPKAERRIPILGSARWRWELYPQHWASSSLGQVRPNSLIFAYRMRTLPGRQEIVPYPSPTRP